MKTQPTTQPQRVPQLQVRCDLRAGDNQDLCKTQVKQAQVHLNQLIQKAKNKGCL